MDAKSPIGHEVTGPFFLVVKRNRYAGWRSRGPFFRVVKKTRYFRYTYINIYAYNIYIHGYT